MRDAILNTALSDKISASQTQQPAKDPVIKIQYRIVMFESFRSFVAEFVEGEQHPSQFADNDYRLAAVALLVHTAGSMAMCRSASAINCMRS